MSMTTLENLRLGSGVSVTTESSLKVLQVRGGMETSCCSCGAGGKRTKVISIYRIRNRVVRTWFQTKPVRLY